MAITKKYAIQDSNSGEIVSPKRYQTSRAAEIQASIMMRVEGRTRQLWACESPEAKRERLNNEEAGRNETDGLWYKTRGNGGCSQ